MEGCCDVHGERVTRAGPFDVFIREVGRGRVGQGRAGHSGAGQGNEGHGRAGQGMVRQGRAGKNRTRLDIAKIGNGFGCVSRDRSARASWWIEYDRIGPEDMYELAGQGWAGWV